VVLVLDTSRPQNKIGNLRTSVIADRKDASSMVAGKMKETAQM